MVRKSAKVISIDRIVDADLNISELEHRPSQVRQWFSNNIIRPMFAYTLGWTGKKAVMLRATAGGILKVANVGSGLERVESLNGTAGAVESAGIGFTETISRVRIIANDHDMYFRSSRDGVNYEDQVHIKADVEQSFDITTASFMVQRYGLNDADYEVEGYR